MTQYFEKYVAPIIGNEAAEQIDKFCDIAMGKKRYQAALGKLNAKFGKVEG